MESFDSKIIEVMIADRSKRLIIGRKGFGYFCHYYFPSYFTYRLAPFHFEMFQDCQDLIDDVNVMYLLWIMFRESAKTSLTKMFIIWCICYKLKHYILWDSYDKQNSEAATFDIAQELLTNKRIVRDFGELYFDRRSNEQKQLKKVSEFITTNGIKVEALSIGESVRGRVFNRERPDLAVLDDFETMKTIRSLVQIRKTKEHIDELKGGLSPDGNVIYLGNLLSEAGVVYSLVESSERDPLLRYRRVDVVDPKGQITWSDKYVKTDKEANKINLGITDRKQQIVSLEAKKRTLNADGRKVYEVEMLNSPEAAGDLMFDRAIIEHLLKEVRKPKVIIAGMKIWMNYNPAHIYGAGADVAKGVGRDSNANVIIDFTIFPNRVIATYKNNEMKADIFGYELVREGKKFDFPFLGIEITGGTGLAALATAKMEYPLEKLYRPIPKKKVKEQPKNQLGWETNGGTKPKMIFDLKTAVEDGILLVEDESLLKEMKSYSQVDLESPDDPESTRHFDLLTACAIAWQMKTPALMLGHGRRDAESYRQPAYEGGVLEQKGSESIFNKGAAIQDSDYDYTPKQRSPFSDPGSMDFQQEDMDQRNF